MSALKRTISALLIITMIATVWMPMTVSARTLLPQKGTGKMNLQMSADGVLTWDAVPGATGYYFSIGDVADTNYLDTNYQETSFRFAENFDSRRLDSKSYTIRVSAIGEGLGDFYDSMLYYYVSPFDKLEAPTNLRWDGSVARWDAVPNADGYTVYLVQPRGTNYASFKVEGNTPYKDFSNVSGLNSGWWFEVEATATEGYRDSVRNESPKVFQSRENAAQTVEGNINLKMSADGILTWDAVPNATCYSVDATTGNNTIVKEDYYTDTRFSFFESLDSRKIDSDAYAISVSAQVNGLWGDFTGKLLYYYVSPYNKLEAPTNLRWEGTTARWDATPHADGYTVHLIQPSGTNYASFKVEGSTAKDFSDIPGLSTGWWFEVEATSTAATPNFPCRTSARSESPKSPNLTGVTYAVNCFAYDIVNERLAGGTVTVETDLGSATGTTPSALASDDAIVRLTAVPEEGYIFAGWRKSTPSSPSATVSTNEVHAYRVMQEEWYYAIFLEEGAETIFPAGCGFSAGNPAYCTSFEEFKYAMEHPAIRYVALGKVDETLPLISGSGLITAVSVNGTKELQLVGDACFLAPMGNYKTYAALLHTVSGVNLTVTGSGSLTFKAVANSSYNAVIYNQGGTVTINNGTLIGSFNPAVYGKAIWQSYGELYVNGGRLEGENALTPGKLPLSHSAVWIEGGQARIRGGYFKETNIIDTIDLPYGLEIGGTADVELTGGIFEGILPKKGTTMSSYLGDGCEMTVDGTKTDPATCTGVSGKTVEIYQAISEVDLHINSPVHGNNIPVYVENVYNAPENTRVKFVNWLEDDGTPATSQFQAGKRYKVEIGLTAENGARFIFPLESATVNFKNATVQDQSTASESAVLLTLDFG
ncbi:MAG: hypothetical protein IJP27_08795, partial [Clostridia bacterium]|nr:hypothetical protein [Clostridia bacterium]